MQRKRKNLGMTLAQIKKMETVCQLAAQTLQYAAKLVAPGVTTGHINDAVHEYTLSLDAQSAPLNYHGFPKSVCTSVNDVVCHGVPRDDEVLMPGDAINIDVTLKKAGFFGDTSATFFVGEVTDNVKKVTEAAKKGMMAGIEQVKAGNRTGDIGYATNKVVTNLGFYTVKAIGGHGIGDQFHKDPFVPAAGRPKSGEILRENTCITVEPMVNETSEDFIEFQIPDSSICYYKTIDGTATAQFEHTILITKNGYEILTAW
ncbi:MAG: type I methionyl aminopeptidase [Lentisphaeraceae bacterium]|nr:type I methionyl aminopeptidase [Lentisphaeraceae bacterium]